KALDQDAATDHDRERPGTDVCEDAVGQGEDQGSGHRRRGDPPQQPLGAADEPQVQQALGDQIDQGGQGSTHQDLLIRGAVRALVSDSRTGAREEGPSHGVTGTPASSRSRTVRSRSSRRSAQASGQNLSGESPAALGALPVSTETSPMLAGRVSTTITSAPRETSSPIWVIAAFSSRGEHTTVKVPGRTCC